MSRQCEAKTKSGTRCQKKTHHQTKRCHHHRDVQTFVETKAHPIVTRVEESSKLKKSKKNAPSSDHILSNQSSEKIECCVCMEEMYESDKLDCSHGVCRSCLLQLRNNTCPVCRRDIKAKHVTNTQKKIMKERFNADRLEAYAYPSETYISRQVRNNLDLMSYMLQRAHNLYIQEYVNV